MPEQFVTLANGVTLAFHEQGPGSAPAVVLLHGWPDSWRSFELVLAALGSSSPPVRALAPSLRGFGHSDRPADGYRPHDLAADVVAFLDAVGVSRAVLVGHSMGSFVAETVAVEHPDRVRGWCSSAGSSGSAATTAVGEVATLLTDLSDPIDRDFVVEFQGSALVRPVPEAFFATLVDEATMAPARVWRSVMDGLRTVDHSAALAAVTVPSLLIWGAEDGLIPEAERDALVLALPAAEVELYEGVGHSPNWEDPTRAWPPPSPPLSAGSIRARRSDPVVNVTAPDAVVVGLDVGGTKTNATVLAEDGAYLVDCMLETPSRVHEGPTPPSTAIETAMARALDVSGAAPEAVRAVGLDTPGPASANGVISARGATNFSERVWWGFDFRAAVERRLGLPVIYNNDGNAAALYAHHQYFGAAGGQRSSISAIVGTGLGGGVITAGAVLRAPPGWPASSGTSTSPSTGCWCDGQPVPAATAVSPATSRAWPRSAAIERNLLPFWLTRYPDHPLGASLDRDRRPAGARARRPPATRWRGGSSTQQATAIGRMFTIASNFVDPDVYFVGGGVIEAEAPFRTVVPGHGQGAHRAARRAGQDVGVRAGRRPRHGRRPRVGPRRPPRHPPVVLRRDGRNGRASCRSVRSPSTTSSARRRGRRPAGRSPVCPVAHRSMASITMPPRTAPSSSVSAAGSSSPRSWAVAKMWASMRPKSTRPSGTGRAGRCRAGRRRAPSASQSRGIASTRRLKPSMNTEGVRRPRRPDSPRRGCGRHLER